MAPDGQLCATWATVSADTVSGKIHSPGVLALKTVGASSTQWREWMQRLASKLTVTSRPLAISIFDSVGIAAAGAAGKGGVVLPRSAGGAPAIPTPAACSCGSRYI